MNSTSALKQTDKPWCGLCGKTKHLVKTDCCGQWICDDEHTYVLFSYARNSCSRNHRRFTLCGFHHSEAHQGHWKDCQACRKSFQAEMYVWYGTNEYNFEVLENPPQYEPTRCSRCGVVIKLGTDGYTVAPEGTFCERCANRERRPTQRPSPRKLKAVLPVNPNTSAIEIILSTRVQKRWRIKPDVRAHEPPAHWLGQWRVDLAQRADRSWVTLVTNVATLYTFVFPLKELGNGANFEKLFRLRLGFALVEVPSLAHWQDAPIVFATGNPRVAVGSMNDMRQGLSWPAPKESGAKDDEDHINGTPYFSLCSHFPDKEFARRLAAKGLNA